MDPAAADNRQAQPGLCRAQTRQGAQDRVHRLRFGSHGIGHGRNCRQRADSPPFTSKVAAFKVGLGRQPSGWMQVGAVARIAGFASHSRRATWQTRFCAMVRRTADRCAGRDANDSAVDSAPTSACPFTYRCASCCRRRRPAVPPCRPPTGCPRSQVTLTAGGRDQKKLKRKGARHCPPMQQAARLPLRPVRPPVAAGVSSWRSIRRPGSVPSSPDRAHRPRRGCG